MDKGYIVRWQHDLVNTNNVLYVCNKPYHTKKEILQKEGDWNFTELCIIVEYHVGKHDS